MKFQTIGVVLAVCALVAAHGWDYQEHENYRHPKYQFKYGVNDPKSGDIKDQWEERDGDRVKGSYSLKEADGTTRVVEYYADGQNGFHAIVKKIGHAHYPVAGHHKNYANPGHYGHYGYGQATSYINVNHY